MSVAALVLLLSFSSQASASPAERVSVVGKVREVGGGLGGAGQAILVLEDERGEVTLHGTGDGDDEELKRLGGTRVKVTGVRGDPLLPRGHVRVDRYEILDVGGGVVPRIGHIAVLPLSGRARLIFVADDGIAQLLPESWMQKMEKHIGAKIWIAGNRSEKKDELVPERFGILRPGAKSAAKSAKTEDRKTEE